jgi:vacuolar-type H+-ATPase subunit E/Vma4
MTALRAQLIMLKAQREYLQTSYDEVASELKNLASAELEGSSQKDAAWMRLLLEQVKLVSEMLDIDAEIKCVEFELRTEPEQGEDW